MTDPVAEAIAMIEGRVKTITAERERIEKDIRDGSERVKQIDREMFDITTKRERLVPLKAKPARTRTRSASKTSRKSSTSKRSRPRGKARTAAL